MEREERYIVVKLKRLSAHEAQCLREYLCERSIPTEECVVVESDWPIYEETWDSIRQLEEKQPLFGKAAAVREFAEEVWDELLKQGGTIKVLPLTMAKNWIERNAK